jgi:hypothetical protein
MWECGGDERVWRAEDGREIVSMWKGITEQKEQRESGIGRRGVVLMGVWGVQSWWPNGGSLCVDLCSSVEKYNHMKEDSYHNLSRSHLPCSCYYNETQSQFPL